MLPDMPLLLAFVGASLMLAITPDPRSSTSWPVLWRRVAHAVLHLYWASRLAISPMHWEPRSGWPPYLPCHQPLLPP